MVRSAVEDDRNLVEGSRGEGKYSQNVVEDGRSVVHRRMQECSRICRSAVDDVRSVVEGRRCEVKDSRNVVEYGRSVQ
jgi:hypothetical protein